ncbi:hypothetical protein Agub_g11084 [Astrephomene gubernaculifera]|uniref:Flagellar associated protein n=1 Tax=Astrephomene gubernaculifera TaxID=47775 RepID=A0AAD3DYQ4_9CHLO|nr:hypothetical protein Agub_g11084 [Astrephomene gubernaculifera]
MAQQVMTNLGPRRKGSARLDPLPFANGRTSPTEMAGEPQVVLPDGRAASSHLPPLNRARDPASETFDSVLAEEVSPGVSPARRARKAALMTRSVDVDHRTVLQASLALDQKEREMSLVRDNKREYGRILLELWVNQVLDAQSTSAAGALGAAGKVSDALKMDASALRGLASYGLTRVELLGAGLSNDAIDRLYRCMYVYTVGFFDVMQDILSHNDFRTEILSNVWKGFLTIAESALQVSFRSDYLKLYQSQQVAMAELLFAKEQLTEAQQDSVNTEKAIAWLTNAHAEERAARQMIKAQLQEVQGMLERERQAHQAAVTKYVAEVEERVRLQAELVSATAKLAEAAVAQVDLVVQRDQLTSQLLAAEQRAGRIVEHVKGMYDALAMEKAFTPNPQLVTSLDALLSSAAASAQASGSQEARTQAAEAEARAIAAAEAEARAEAEAQAAAAAPGEPGEGAAEGAASEGAAGAVAVPVTAAPTSSSSVLPAASVSGPGAATAATGGVARGSASGGAAPPGRSSGTGGASTTGRGSNTGGRLSVTGLLGAAVTAANEGGLGSSLAGGSGNNSAALSFKGPKPWPQLPPLEAAARSEATMLYADLISDLTKQLYGMWREQSDHATSTTRSLYEARDNLRDSRMREHELQLELGRTRSSAQELQRLLDDSEAGRGRAQAALEATQAALQALKEAKAAADESISDLTHSLDATRDSLERTQVERNRLLASLRTAEDDIDTRDTRIRRLERRLEAGEDTLGEVSRAMVVYAKAAAAQDIARGYFKKRFLEASKRAGDLQWSIFRAERQVRALEGKIEHKNTELATLASATEQAKHQAEQVQLSLAGAMMDIENKKAMIGSLERALNSAREEIQKLRQDLEETVKRAETAEMELEDAREEIQRQSEGMQALEGRIATAGEERARLLKQVERLVSEKAEVERMSKQQRDSLQSEINRRGMEIASLRAELETVNGRLEATRSELAGVRDQLERKREKKKRWKHLHDQSSAQCESLRGALAEREGLVAELAARLEPLEVDVALLMADRCRDMSAVNPPEPAPEKDTAEAQDQPEGDITGVQLQWDECTRQMLELSARLETQQRAVEAARREYETARAAFYESPTEEGRKAILLGIEAVLAKLRVERAETESDLNRLRERQIQLRAHMQGHENVAFKIRMKLLSKRTNKTDFALKHELVCRLDEARDRTNLLQGSVDQQTAAATTAQMRAAKLEMDFVKTEAELRDLSDKLRRTLEFKVELERQVAQYKNMVAFLQAEVSSLSRERDALKANLQDADARITALTNDVSEAQMAVGTTSKRLELKYESEKREALAAALDRQRILEGKMAACEARMKEVEALNRSANDSLRRYLAATLHQLETRMPPAFIWHIARPEHIREAILACSGKARTPQQQQEGAGGAGGAGAAAAAVAAVLAEGEGSKPNAPPPSLVAALGGMPFRTNFDYDRDTVLSFMSGSWSFDITLVVISQVYVEKLLADIRAEEGLLGGMAGPRHSLESVLYDFFTLHFGCRPAAELHLAAFLASVRRFRTQHPKVRTFARLLGLPEPPPTPSSSEDVLTRGSLPPPAVEFYLALVNRVHARAGPLIAEAAEGFSLVKSKVLARIAREFLRGSFATTRDDVAATPEHIRHMALNDEEKAIDLELALEAMLRAFMTQYHEDFEALCATFRASFDNVGRKLVTLDDLSLFLRQLNAEKAASLPPSRALAMYVEASRAAGANAEQLGRELCRAVLNSGFVGISTHVTRHEPMRSLPPYDEFELLEESWRLMRVAVEQQVAVLRTHTESVKCDVTAYVDLARRVDELVGGRDNPQPAWSTYRRLLTTYCSLREAVDAILPFDPPIGTLLNASRARATIAVPAPEAAPGEEGEAAAARPRTEEETPSPADGTSREASPAGRRPALKTSASRKNLGKALSRESSGRFTLEPAMFDLSGTGGATAAAARKSGKLLAPRGANPDGATLSRYSTMAPDRVASPPDAVSAAIAKLQEEKKEEA